MNLSENTFQSSTLPLEAAVGIRLVRLSGMGEQRQKKRLFQTCA